MTAAPSNPSMYQNTAPVADTSNTPQNNIGNCLGPCTRTLHPPASAPISRPSWVASKASWGVLLLGVQISPASSTKVAACCTHGLYSTRWPSAQVIPVLTSLGSSFDKGLIKAIPQSAARRRSYSILPMKEILHDATHTILPYFLGFRSFRISGHEDVDQEQC